MQPKKDSIIKIHTHPIKAALLGQNEPDPTEWMDCFHELPATSRQRYWVEQWAHNLQAGQSLQLSPSEQEIFYFWQGLSPQTYAQLGQTQSMTLDLPKNYPIDPFWQYWGRDGHHTTERIEDEHALSVLEAEHTICFRVQRKNQSLTIHWQGPFGYQVHQQMVRLLNLSFQAPNWPADLILSQSQDAAEATRPFLTRTVWEAILWVILGQQINLSFAYQMRSNLYRNLGQPVGHDLYAAPHPKSLLETPLETFRSWQISRQKASTLLAVAAVWPELAQLSFWHGAPHIERNLLAVKGIGPWSVAYLLMRGFGFADVCPIGDAGLKLAIQKLLNMPERPSPQTILDFMAPYRPFRSQATFCAWKTLGDL